MMEIEIIHVFYILIVILFVVLMNNYAVEGLKNLNLEYVNKMTSKESIEYCKGIPKSWQDKDSCLSKFYYNTDTNQIEACIGDILHIKEHYWMRCNSKHDDDYYGDRAEKDIDNHLTCKKADDKDPDTYQSCPNCDDNSFYSLDEKRRCTDNLDICNSCLTDDTISWNNSESKDRIASKGTAYGDPSDNSISYKGTNPLKDCSNTTEFCEEQQSDCFDDIRLRFADIKGNSSETCSNESILNTIERKKIISDKCKYDNVPVVGEDVWLKQFLETDGYCDPTATTDWKCQRSLPKYCKTKDDCEYDMEKKQCICRPPKTLLNNGECGIPTCPGKSVPGGTCPEGKEPHMFAPFGATHPICECN